MDHRGLRLLRRCLEVGTARRAVLTKRGTGDRGIDSAKVQIGRRPVQRCEGRAEFRVQSTDYGRRAQVGAWLRRALLIRSARRSLAPTEFALRRTPRLARSANPTRGKEDSTWCCPYPTARYGEGPSIMRHTSGMSAKIEPSGKTV